MVILRWICQEKIIPTYLACEFYIDNVKNLFSEYTHASNTIIHHSKIEVEDVFQNNTPSIYEMYSVRSYIHGHQSVECVFGG